MVVLVVERDQALVFIQCPRDQKVDGRASTEIMDRLRETNFVTQLATPLAPIVRIVDPLPDRGDLQRALIHEPIIAHSATSPGHGKSPRSGAAAQIKGKKKDAGAEDDRYDQRHRCFSDGMAEGGDGGCDKHQQTQRQAEPVGRFVVCQIVEQTVDHHEPLWLLSKCITRSLAQAGDGVKPTGYESTAPTRRVSAADQMLSCNGSV